MNSLNKIAVTALSLAALSSSVFADNINDDIRESKAGIEALNSTLVSLGVNEDTHVDVSGVITPSQKLALYDEKYQELQNTFDNIHFSQKL
ncbi:hypothetical protein [Marinomonas mediterranea]|jgi:hypothetical protein|uniref:Uncharacterized protein n=1 Tax=Marinomonas mediterranea (strain ATCC 700492 / JCM 21426 / NBRC 103028 / MMB-1) TaxID=717774 RepID=F2JUV5_MARM1|nr:hypothetical protein [Marinomonas mediterranea]ADZ90520.1 hypothetical protein Marme_1247 [Marinomonas mediterranea MMB-1]WCN08573.1 hypothetical protein GV055_06340 [Marinomonas mediterranea]WCN12627.1 hypothetical protein GV054_06180 [Marinomonas mediterranea]WCN16699.1 hypothetical protein GV053_06310 [Marinomonas mediterranea MMB-1]